MRKKKELITTEIVIIFGKENERKNIKPGPWRALNIKHSKHNRDGDVLFMRNDCVNFQINYESIWAKHTIM